MPTEKKKRTPRKKPPRDLQQEAINALGDADIDEEFGAILTRLSQYAPLQTKSTTVRDYFVRIAEIVKPSTVPVLPTGASVDGAPPIPFHFSIGDRVEADAQLASINPAIAGQVGVIGDIRDGARSPITIKWGTWRNYGTPDEVFTVVSKTIGTETHLRPASVGDGAPLLCDPFGPMREVWAYAAVPFGGVSESDVSASTETAAACALCGNRVKYRDAAAVAIIGGGGGQWASPNLSSLNMASLGYWPVGEDCHRKHMTTGVRVG